MIVANKLKRSIKDMLLQGTSPGKIAMSVALGGVLGIFPIPGLSTAMCALTAMILRLNHAVIQAVNYAVYPLQLLLLGGYVALGNQWLGGSGSIESFNSLAALMRNDFWSGLLALKQLGFHAVVVWLVTSPLLAVAVYFPTRLVAVKLKGTLNRNKAEALRSEKWKTAPGPKPAQNSYRQIGWSGETWQAAQNLDCENCTA